MEHSYAVVSAFRHRIGQASDGLEAVDQQNSSSCSAIPGVSMLADLAAACMALLSVYSQWSIPRQTAGQAQALLARLLLATAGTAVGLLAVKFGRVADVGDTSPLALFLIGFGQVHAPAAVVLLLKSQRTAGVALTRE